MTFALDMLKACFKHPAMSRGHQFGGMWADPMISHLDDGGPTAIISVLLLIHGAPSRVSAHFHLLRINPDDPWDRGACAITLPDEASSNRWVFDGKLEGDLIQVSLVSYEINSPNTSGGLTQEDLDNTILNE